MSIDLKVSKSVISFKKAMKLLDKRVEEIKNNKNKELIWLLEHPLTFTAGIRSNNNEVFDKKVNIIKTNRGGKITLHNPGQKIIYFVLNLNKRKKDIRKLINAIEKSIIEFLKIYKIKGKSDKKNIGIWVKEKKIAAIGVRVSRWVAYHGFSININNDLNEYLKIKPCGLDNSKITSIYNEKKKNIYIDEKELINIFVKNINKI
jgi:lipoyl(octanoyl) transferase|tara:strand:- start:437 stop:1048 length:612 start_codon:yes stop_codon:yes gene_type:complete